MSKRTYEVTGPGPFHGHAPGEKFEADLDPEQERRAIARGSIRAVRGGGKSGEEANEDA